MTKTELKEAWENYNRQSDYIREVTGKSLIKETSAEQEARIKRLLKPENYLDYFEYYFGVESGLSDDPCAKFHLDSYLKVYDNRSIKQFRRWFRGAAKSVHTNIGNVCHLKENKELYFGLIVGKINDNANLLLADLQMQFESNERYIKDFGMQVQYGTWADGEFETNDKQFFKALGINQPFRGLRRGGRRPDFASVDDVEDRKEAKNIELTKEKAERITGDIGKGGSKKGLRVIIANNYIVRDGINDKVLEKYKDSKNLHVHTVNLCERVRDSEGRIIRYIPNWPERYTPEECEAIINDSDYYTSEREDFNNPIEEGKRFKESWLRSEKLHGNKIWDQNVEFWDLSYKKEGDFKGGAIGAFEKGKCYILELFNRQIETPLAMDTHYQWEKKFYDKGMAITSYYDATAAQKEVFSPIWEEARVRNNSYTLPIPDHATGDKHERIIATLVNAFFNGLIIFDERLLEGEDYKKFREHYLAFEKGCNTPDDILDCLEQIVRKGRLLFGIETPDSRRPSPLIHKHKRRSV